MKSHRLIVTAFGVATLIIIVSRLPSLARPIWNVDEAFTAVTANVLLQGGTPYRDSVDHRAPVTYFVYALVFGLAGKNNMIALHVVLAGAVVGILGLVALLSRQVLRRPGVVFSLIYFAVASTLAFEPSDMFAFHTEWVVIVFTSLGMLFCWRALSRPRPLGSAILCGICYGLACFTKQPAGLDVLATLMFLGILAWVGPLAATGISRRKVLTLILGIVVGGIAVAGVVCGYFLARGAWDDFIFYVWTYNRNYYMRAIPFLGKIANAFQAYDFVTASLGLGIFAAFGGALSVVRATGWLGERTPITWRRLHATMWGVSSLLAGLSGARPYYHYFIMLLPAWCLLAGIAFESLLFALRPTVPAEMPTGRKWRRIALMVVMAFLLLCPRLLMQVGIIDTYWAKIESWVRTESKDRLLTYLQRECPADERIVVWGFNPELYIEANRDPATRYSYTTFVVGLMPGVINVTKKDALRWAVPGAMEIFAQELRKNRPLFIVDLSQSVNPFWGSYFGFDLFPLVGIKQIEAILSNYELVPEFSPNAAGDDGIRVYRRHD